MIKADLNGVLFMLAIFTLAVCVMKDSNNVYRNVGTVSPEQPKKQVKPTEKPTGKVTQKPAGGSDYAEVSQGGESAGRHPFQSCVDQQGSWLSSNLLPKTEQADDQDWSVYAPGKIEDKNFLTAGYHLGVDTVSNSLRNANLQLRSEPIIPKVEISPFMGSTIEGDEQRRRFDIQDF
tara:strand:- start:3320 stop:3850 length:531 start_codon:yes stop_codon:yes gene_type:complete